MKATKADGKPIARLWPVEGPWTVDTIAGRCYIFFKGEQRTGYMPREKAQSECDRLNLQWRADRMKRIAHYILMRVILGQNKVNGWELMRRVDRANVLICEVAEIEAQLYTQRYNLTNTSNETE